MGGGSRAGAPGQDREPVGLDVAIAATAEAKAHNAGGTLLIQAPHDPDHEERAIYQVGGEVEIAGESFEAPRL